MSHDQGRRLVRRHTPGHAGRPALDRPSLFAADDVQDSVLDDDTQRVRILSTLESARRPVRVAPSKARRLQRQGSSWQIKALVALMGAGVIALLTSFVLVVVDGHTTSTQVEAAMVEQAAKSGLMPAAQPAPTSAALPTAASVQPPLGKTPDKASAKAASHDNSNNPLAALIAPAAAPPSAATAKALAQTAPKAAVIETVPREAPAAPTPAPPTITTKASSGQAKVPAVKPPVDALALQRGLNVPAASGKNARGAQGTNNRDDEDVALLEAMFAHTGSRKAPVSVAEEIKRQCGQLAGAEAATCRARLCVQNPAAPICHPEP